VATLVQSMYALTPSEELTKENIPTIALWMRERRFWFPWVQTVRIGGTSESEVIEMTHEIYMVPGLDTVGNLYFSAFNFNWAALAEYRCDIYYELTPVDRVVRRQLRVKDRDPN